MGSVVFLSNLFLKVILQIDKQLLCKENNAIAKNNVPQRIQKCGHSMYCLEYVILKKDFSL